ncbi:MAG TPA: sulfurtransferase TusA family protein [Caulobacteraceae bacterium]|nr:sulfurtransferase TusA family protein [Caulobacteraceae bacterium]
MIVDARGHRCPVPTLKLRKAIETLEAGGLVRLLADDPMARIDVPHFAAAGGHQVISVEDDHGATAFIVKKAS